MGRPRRKPACRRQEEPSSPACPLTTWAARPTPSRGLRAQGPASHLAVATERDKGGLSLLRAAACPPARSRAWHQLPSGERRKEALTARKPEFPGPCQSSWRAARAGEGRAGQLAAGGSARATLGTEGAWWRLNAVASEGRLCGAGGRRLSARGAVSGPPREANLEEGGPGKHGNALCPAMPSAL